MRYYGTPWEIEADFPFNFDLIKIGSEGSLDKTEIEIMVNDWMREMPNGKVANWVVGNHDNVRLASRLPNLTNDQVNWKFKPKI